MPITAKATTMYEFKVKVGPLAFAFNVGGESEEQAKQTLISSLKLALGQLTGDIEAE